MYLITYRVAADIHYKYEICYVVGFCGEQDEGAFTYIQHAL